VDIIRARYARSSTAYFTFHTSEPFRVGRCFTVVYGSRWSMVHGGRSITAVQPAASRGALSVVSMTGRTMRRDILYKCIIFIVMHVYTVSKCNQSIIIQSINQSINNGTRPNCRV